MDAQDIQDKIKSSRPSFKKILSIHVKNHPSIQTLHQKQEELLNMDAQDIQDKNPLDPVSKNPVHPVHPCKKPPKHSNASAEARRALKHGCTGYSG